MKRPQRFFSQSRRAVVLMASAAVIAASSYGASVADVLSPSAKGYLQRARMMLSDKNFAGTQDQINLLFPNEATLSDALRQECRFMLAKAIYERGGEECVEILRAYVAEYPASPQALEARLTIADYYFFSGKYADALKAYSDIDIDALNGADRLQYTYRKALCMVKTGLGNEASRLFDTLASHPDYRTAATFYRAYLDYADGRYEDAYNGFREAERQISAESARRRSFDPTGLDAKYYMAQLEYVFGRYGKALESAQSIISQLRSASASERTAKRAFGASPSTPEQMLPEMLRVAGESSFKLGDEGRAYPLLREYVGMAGDSAAASAIYTLGVIDYNNGNYEDASSRFASLTDLDNEIGQSASLYSGQCGVKLGDDTAAAMAFERAYRMGIDRNVTETALYNYVAARTRGGNIPFGSSVELLEDFLSKFPRSEYKDAVEHYLATAYYNENDYARALKSINNISRPTTDVMLAKQKILYELGMEAMSGDDTAAARRYMQQAIDVRGGNKALAAQARLWLGDALYAEGEFGDAAKAYEAYLSADPQGDNRALAFYDLAYAQYMQDKFGAAAKSFSSALSSRPALAAALKSDAKVRLADCRYYEGDFRSALKGYTEAIEEGTPDAAYATYRRAVMLGLAGDTRGKIRELQVVETRYADTQWAPAAMLEEGLTLLSTSQAAKGEKRLRDVADKYPESPEARKSLLQLALYLNGLGKASDAEAAYKDVIRRWPSSEEAMLAHEDLRVAYAGRGSLEEYGAFLSLIPGAPRISQSEAERLSYDAAANAYAADIADISRLEAFVERYPDSQFTAQALLDIAESYYERGNPDKALAAADKLLSRRSDAVQVPEALLIKADVLEKHHNDRAAALRAYRQLERRGGADFAADAAAGIMRTTDDASERSAYAAKVKESGGLSAEQLNEANFFEAQGLEERGNIARAETIYSELAQNPKSLYGARAAVALGDIYNNTRRYSDAEQLLTKLVEEGTPHQYELARAYIALADAYAGQGKKYLALEYVRSLKQNYPGKEPDIMQMINQRIETWK